ncbi:hypothetical protein E3J62_07375 [candidate division TA06 bacterium]|uniref:Intracellular proteinase inhibitor BsuPI domain-containing protein n=1 Tax=candidate division TA06 bacterium TaxID=2250710 RepID=A0A523USP6_UNCT6|nr:MAG: hypothetical protein E3J62_07375 [candidate division TA06 bacterium]
MKRRRRMTSYLLVFCLFLPCVAKAGLTVVGGLTHVKDAALGESYRGIIFVTNKGETALEAKIHQTDYLFFCNGKNIYGEPGGIRRSNANWIEFSPRRLLIPPKSISQVNYTVKVPYGRALVGTYWSMLMLEEIPKGSFEAIKRERDKSQVGIRMVLRYGIQMITNIGDTGVRKLKFLKTKVVSEHRKKFLQVDIENVGERWLRALLWVELYDIRGSYVGRFEGGKLRVYPGTSVRYEVDLSHVPKGKYDALIVADCGGEDLFGVTYTLEFRR